MPSAKLKKATERWHAGEIDFPAFLAETSGEWEKMAAKILRRWRVPEHVLPLDDAKQEMMLGVVTARGSFNPARGEVGAWVSWVANDLTKKLAHKARGAGRHGNPGRRPSRIPVLFSTIENEAGYDGPAGPEAVEAALSRGGRRSEPTQERDTERRLRLDRAYASCESLSERVSVGALSRSDGVEDAARRLYADPNYRLLLRAGSEGRMRQTIREDAKSVAQRLEPTYEGEGT